MHAAGNVVSMKIITNVPGVSNLITRINEELPPEIRLWNFVSCPKIRRKCNFILNNDSEIF